MSGSAPPRSRPYFAWRLTDSAVWVDRFGSPHPIETMESGYVANVLSMLLQEAPRWADDLTRGSEESLSPNLAGSLLDWLESTPIWVSLVAILVARGDIAGPEGLFEHLRARHYAHLLAGLEERMADFDDCVGTVRGPRAEAENPY